MELFYIYLILSGILFVFSIFTGVDFLISEADYSRTRFVEFLVATVVAVLFCLGHFISARVKENKKEHRENPNRHSPS